MTDSVRHLQKWGDMMIKYHGEIERLVYAAEIACEVSHKGSVCQASPDTVCPFKKASPCHIAICRLHSLRVLLGDHVKQDHLPLPSQTL